MALVALVAVLPVVVVVEGVADVMAVRHRLLFHRLLAACMAAAAALLFFKWAPTSVVIGQALHTIMVRAGVALIVLFGPVIHVHSHQLARPMSKNNFLGKNHESLYRNRKRYF
jgi:hypothetical protein